MRACDIAVLEGFDPKVEPQLIRMFADQWCTEHRTIEQARAVIRASSIVLRPSIVKPMNWRASPAS